MEDCLLVFVVQQSVNNERTIGVFTVDDSARYVADDKNDARANLFD